MILDIVDVSMPNTNCRDLDAAAKGKGPGRRRLSSGRSPGLPVLVSVVVALFLVSSLAACGGKDGDGQQATAGAQAPVGSPAAAIISTVAATGKPAAAVPTTAAVSTTAPPTPTLTPTPPAPLAAIVNGQYVFLADYERRVAQFEQAMLSQGLDPSVADGQTSLAQIRQQVLDSLIDYVLIEQGGAALGVTVGDAELEAQIETDIAAGGGQAAFDQWLQATGQTRDDYKEMLRESLLSQRVMDAISTGVPDAVEQVHARQIVVDSESAAQEIVTVLRQGADFVALARERSVDLATRDNGGDLGWFPRGLIAPELERAAFALQPGEISDVVPLGEQYHIIQVVERDTARQLSPEEKVDLNFALFDRWLAEQRAAAVIERFVGE
jgi:parvulin-like peptidyl-prolyl isomerase